MFEWLKNEGDKINLLPKYILNLSLLNPCCHCPTSAITFFFPPAQLPASLFWGLFPLLPYPLTLILHVTIHVPEPICLLLIKHFFSSVHLICYSASLQPQILFPCSRFIVDTSTYRVAKHENYVSSSSKSGLARVSLSGVTRAHPQNETQFSSEAVFIRE